jgi:predicted aminopeptidase
LFFLLALSACAAPSYYNQAISGHMRLMNQREDVREILGSGEADPELLRELELSINIRDFAVKQLGLPENNSYTQYVGTGQSAVTWNVVAVPEFSLTPRKWCFLASGCVPYRGYFEEAAARKFAGSLDHKGLDTTISPAIAYSTLGWFDDPLLDTMFQYSDEQLAAFIFHELAHQQLYIKGDTAFNEAYASFVEEAGLTRWLEAEGRTGYAVTRKAAEKASLQLNSLLQSTRNDLAHLYAGEVSEQKMRAAKAAIFNQLRRDYQDLVDTKWEGKNYYKSITSGELNNASLALVNTYQGGACAFEKLFRQAGSDILKFHEQAAEKARLGKEARGDWLNQPCEDIASNSDM